MCIEKPTVLNIVRSGDFVAKVYAYRKLTRNECWFAVQMYMRQYRLKKLPSKGEALIYTHFGYNDPDTP